MSKSSVCKWGGPSGLLRSILFFVLGVSISTVNAAGENADWLITRYQAIVDNPDTFQEAYNAGRERSTLCSFCHGEDGNSIKDDVPNLAGQNPLYLWTQIDHFANGSRKNFVMEALAREFSHDDKLNLAIYFSAKNVRSQAADSSRAKKGRVLYKQSCMVCHGESAHGTEKFARLAGQKAGYLLQTLKSFRAAANNPSSKEAVRRSESMEMITRTLTDEDMLNLVAFLSSKY
ncbi:hypothetical protein MNBD_GAMMA25-801 [hydrothermal vent metagenome]|uniref:Cytochrome c domain-containing protein n=1 Tax=hydrothermal vent metagenome TaxID=652676 RepID=A0A3B1BQB8_9ZZZZ